MGYFTKTKHSIAGTSNMEETSHRMAKHMAETIIKELNLPNGTMSRPTPDSKYYIIDADCIDKQLGTPALRVSYFSQEVLVQTRNGWANFHILNAVDGIYSAAYFTYKCDNLLVVTMQELNPGQVEKFTGSYIVFFMPKDSQTLWSYSVTNTAKATVNNLSGTDTITPLIVLPTPKPSECFMANVIFNNKFIDKIISFKTNPMLSSGEFATIGGNTCFITNNYGFVIN